jgi:N-acetylglutamate synthase-like GNAT family acetyltransferase
VCAVFSLSLVLLSFSQLKGTLKMMCGSLCLEAINSIHRLSMSKYFSLYFSQLFFRNFEFSSVNRHSVAKQVLSGAIFKYGGMIISSHVRQLIMFDI